MAFELKKSLSAVAIREHLHLERLLDELRRWMVLDRIDTLTVALDRVRVLERHEV